MPLKLEVGGVAEVVQVTGAARVVDTSSTTIGAVINTDDLKSIPVGRTFSATLYLAPGVSSSGTLGAANPSMSGGTGLDNQYVIDGANVTNTGYGGLGSYSITFGSLGNATPYDFVKEVQVKTGGYEAEFGQATGGVVNVITKSGSNQFRGSAFGYSQPSGLESRLDAVPGDQRSVQHRVHEDRRRAASKAADAIVKDQAVLLRRDRPGAGRRATFTAPPDFPLASLGEVDARPPDDRLTRRRPPFSSTARNRIDASFFGDPSHGDTGPQRTSALLEDRHVGLQHARLRRPPADRHATTAS